MSCEEVVRALSDYIDGTLAAHERAAVEEHVATCHDCHVVLDTDAVHDPALPGVAQHGARRRAAAAAAGAAREGLRGLRQGRAAPLRGEAAPQASRSAEVIGRRAARSAGSRPPRTPISTAKAMPTATICGVMRKAKAISLKLCVWPVPVE